MRGLRWTNTSLAWLLAALATAAALGALSHWVIFEYDLFWQVRFGRELLAGAPVQTVDHWSHTAYGAPYRNIQWLATIFMALVARISPGYVALGTLRSLLIGAWAFMLCRFARAGRYPWLAAITLAPLVYLAAWFRLQMRPDLFAACIFGLLLTLLLSGQSERNKRVGGLLLLLLWANIHTGTALFGILLYGAFIFVSALPFPTRILYASLGALSWFATPNGIAIVGIIRDNALTYDWSRTHNPDLQPFGLRLLQVSEGGWALRLWVLYCLAAVASLFRPREWLPPLYQNRWFLVVVGGALTLESLHHIRALHYQMVFLLPLVAAGVASLLPRVQLAALGICAILIWGILMPRQIRDVAKPLGDGISKLDLPVQSAAFLAVNKPVGKMHNAYPFGGYLIDALPEYPVSIDGRELPFSAFRDALDQAIRSNNYAAFLREQGIDIAVETLPSAIYDPRTGYIDAQEPLYPRAEWATVFFDNISIVYLRRTKANAGIIAAHEYKAIHRGLPARQSAPSAAAFETELVRCLAESPDNIYCRMGEANFLEMRQDDNAAWNVLNDARKIDPRNLSLLITMLEFAQTRGNQPAVDDLVKTLDRVGNRLGQ